MFHRTLIIVHKAHEEYVHDVQNMWNVASACKTQEERWVEKWQNPTVYSDLSKTTIFMLILWNVSQRVLELHSQGL